MDNNRFIDLCGQLADDQDFEKKLASCNSKEEVVSLFNDYGVNKEEFDELKDMYQEYKAQGEMNGGFDLCLAIGFGSSAACSGKGKGSDDDNGPSTGGGLFGCEVIGIGVGANNPQKAIDSVEKFFPMVGRGISQSFKDC